jgi:hypothetical protein
MAQTKKKRRRKHRGTQGGRIDTRPARGRARSRGEAQNRARSRTKKKGKAGERTPQPASWGSSIKKGAIASVLFVGILALMGQNPIATLVVGVVMLPLYSGMSFVMDGFFYKRHLRKEEQKRLEREASRTGGAQQSEG